MVPSDQIVNPSRNIARKLLSLAEGQVVIGVQNELAVAQIIIAPVVKLLLAIFAVIVIPFLIVVVRR